MSVADLFKSRLKVVSVGYAAFAENLAAAGVETVSVAWRPPLDADPQVMSKLRERRAEIAAANKAALEKMLRARPFLTGMGSAGETIPGMKKNLLLHAGPPVAWEKMCGPMRGAATGALIYEGLAKTAEEAQALAASGAVEFSPCHAHGAAGPVAGIISCSMPVFIVENLETGRKCFAAQSEGPGKTLRYGVYTPDVLERLRWLEKTLYPALKAALALSGPLDLKAIIAQALQMGDELHSRHRAATSLLYRVLAPSIIRTCAPETAAGALEFINGNDQFFSPIAMSAQKAVMDAARGTEKSSIIVAMAKNGVDIGIQLAGTGEQWFTGPSPVPDAKFSGGYGRADANPDIGDSAIAETCGLGAFAAAAAPAVVQFIGGTAAATISRTLEMREICAGENPDWKIPQLEFNGAPAGIDILRAIEKGILPVMHTGAAHREPGIGQIGAGVSAAPPEPFIKAAQALARGL